NENRLELVVQSRPQDMAGCLGPKIDWNAAYRFAERLVIQTVVKIFGFDRPVRRNFSLYSTTDGVSPVESVTASIKEVRINVIAGCVVHSDRASGCVDQPAAVTV